jgi:bifunctional non-homologous end joining protein LigD
VVAKRLTSVYRPGRRSPDWIKTPINHTQEGVIIGYKPGQGRRAGTIGSLVLAVHGPAGQLVFAGGVGTVFIQAMLAQCSSSSSARGGDDIPDRRHPARARPRVQWVDPLYVGEVAYRGWTPEGHSRHPSWRGLRPDRSPDEARRPMSSRRLAPSRRSSTAP